MSVDITKRDTSKELESTFTLYTLEPKTSHKKIYYKYFKNCVNTSFDLEKPTYYRQL